MDGSISDFTATGGEETFKNSLSSELGISLDQIQIQTVQEGSIVVTYDILAQDDTVLEELVSKQTETLATR